MTVPDHSDQNIWEVIQKHGSSQDRKLLLALCLFYGLTSIYIIGYPLWFKEPIMICNHNNGKTYECAEIDACKWGNYTISNYSSKSLTREFSLVCEKSEEKRKAISFSLFGYLIGMLLNMVLPLNSRNRKNWIGFCSLFFFFGALITLVFSHSLQLISYGLCLMGMAYSSGYNNSIVLTSEIFSEEFSKVSYVFMMIVYSMFGIFYPVFSYLTQDNWRFLNGIPMVISLLLGLFIFVIKPERSQVNRPSDIKTISLGNFFYGLQRNPNLRTNFLILTVCWTTMVFTLVGVTIELEGIGGSLHLNMIMFASVEALMSLVTGSLIVKYELLKVKKYSYFLSGLLLSVFIFAPTDLDTLSGYDKLLYIVPVVLNKACLEIAWNLTVIFIPKIIDVSYISLVLSSVMFLARCPTSLTPYINNIFFKLNIHPFVLYCFLWFLSMLLFKYYKINHNVEDVAKSFSKQNKSRSRLLMASIVRGKLNSSDTSILMYKDGIKRGKEEDSLLIDMSKPLLDRKSLIELAPDD